MAWLFIDSSTNQAARIGLLGSSMKLVAVKGRSHAILPAIAKLLRPDAKKNLDGICVVSGPGSFTSIRTGVLVGNLLSRMWRLPLVGVTVEEAKDIETLTEGLRQSKYVPAERVLPSYDAEPNITKPA